MQRVLALGALLVALAAPAAAMAASGDDAGAADAGAPDAGAGVPALDDDDDCASCAVLARGPGSALGALALAGAVALLFPRRPRG